ncbi:hypothetical protein C2G38_2048994 [Gigaspora rosea]|uniref:Uncharacterized protein n=1 Tax=Gigaspora rosea TaxID=44941 RepID=A0A397U0Q2_9GLOM|nr:hypothetical protein C2G38_2048994 [Gigaspora rosea]
MGQTWGTKFFSSGTFLVVLSARFLSLWVGQIDFFEKHIFFQDIILKDDCTVKRNLGFCLTLIVLKDFIEMTWVLMFHFYFRVIDNTYLGETFTDNYGNVNSKRYIGHESEHRHSLFRTEFLQVGDLVLSSSPNVIEMFDYVKRFNF